MVLFDDRLRINIPEDLHLAQEHEAAEVFPHPKRPQLVFANDDFSRFITFSLLNKPMGQQEAMSAAREMRTMVWSLYPNSILSQAAPFSFGDLSCGSFTFRTGSKGAQVFNTMFVASFNGRMLLGTLGCGIDDLAGMKMLQKLMVEAECLEDKDD